MHSNIENHYRKLEKMYLDGAHINAAFYDSIQLSISNEKAIITLKIEPKYFHAAGAIHGSVYFKVLDDAAFFAVNSIVEDVFVYTTSYNIQILRPVSTGHIKAIGEVKFKSKNLFIADSELYDDNNTLVARGSGNFMKSRIALDESIGYK